MPAISQLSLTAEVTIGPWVELAWSRPASQVGSFLDSGPDGSHEHTRGCGDQGRTGDQRHECGKTPHQLGSCKSGHLRFTNASDKGAEGSPRGKNLRLLVQVGQVVP